MLAEGLLFKWFTAWQNFDFRLGDKSATEVDVSEGVLIYEQTVDALSAMWHYNDTESQIARAWYSVGTYPYGQDIASRKEVTMSSTLSSFLANNEVTPDITGKIVSGFYVENIHI